MFDLMLATVKTYCHATHFGIKESIQHYCFPQRYLMEGDKYYSYEIISTQNISFVSSICCGKMLNRVIPTVRN